jgi:hypothetical protein
VASILFNKAKEDIIGGVIDLNADTLKWILVDSTYTADPDTEVVDAAGASDIIDAEISVTGYTGGWGGAGRKTLTNKSFTHDDGVDRAIFDSTVDYTWSSLGSGATIVAAILVKEGGSDDTTSRPIVYVDTNDVSTNGGDITLQLDTNGIFRW